MKVMACFDGTYIDDIRTGGPMERAYKATSRRVASRINSLGQQDASRKRGQPSKVPRAWAGAKCCALEDDSFFITEHKWQKSKIMVGKWHKVVAKEKMQTLLRKGCWVSRSYESNLSRYLSVFKRVL